MDDSSSLWFLCRKYVLPVYRSSDKKTFRNPHCVGLASVQSQVFKCPIYQKPLKSPHVQINSSPPLSRSFEFELKRKKTTKRCKTNEVYIAVENQCRELVFNQNISFFINHELNDTLCLHGITYNATEFIEYRNGSVFVIPHRTNETYKQVNDTILLCVNFTNKNIYVSQISLSSDLTIAGSCASIACFFFFGDTFHVPRIAIVI